jgi:predicted GNAT family N-acyltransferase
VNDPRARGVRAVIVTDPKQRDDAFAVRIAVFVEEQQIPREDEIDEHDDTDAVHCVAYVDRVPAGAGRLVVVDGRDAPCAKIGRMAVLASHRGRGIGAAVLVALEGEAASRGLRVCRLSAQLHARGFYERAGYTAHGDIYDDVGIPHIDMEKRL